MIVFFVCEINFSFNFFYWCYTHIIYLQIIIDTYSFWNEYFVRYNVSLNIFYRQIRENQILRVVCEEIEVSNYLHHYCLQTYAGNKTLGIYKYCVIVY